MHKSKINILERFYNSMKNYKTAILTIRMIENWRLVNKKIFKKCTSTH
jgi:hypothetical protein